MQVKLTSKRFDTSWTVDAPLVYMPKRRGEWEPVLYDEIPIDNRVIFIREAPMRRCLALFIDRPLEG